MTVCKRVYYSGRVQGVGFRWTAQSLAAGYAVTGYVRNLPSGEVELVVEGEPGAVEDFLGAVQGRMAHAIELTRIEDAPPGSHSGFRIRH
jgi:acylphosphatase